MSEPKIINIVAPEYHFGWPSLFASPYLRDGLITPVAVSSGGSSDYSFVYGDFGDGINYVDYTMMLWINHNKLFNGNSFSYGLSRDGASVVGEKLTEITNRFGQQTTIITFPKMNAKIFSFGFSHTNPIGQEKFIGELILANENTITLQRDFSSYEERWREVAKEISLRNGGIHRVVTTSSAGKNLRYEAVAQFNFMSESEIESWRSLKESGATFFFMPESETNPQNIYKCHFTGPFNVKSTTSYKGAGYTISVTLKEVK